MLFFKKKFQVVQSVLICFQWFKNVSCRFRLLYDVSFVSCCVTVLGFCRLFFVVVNCVSMFWVLQIVFWLLWIVSECPGFLLLFGLFWTALGRVLVALGCLVSRPDVLRLFMLFQVVLDCVGY